MRNTLSLFSDHELLAETTRLATSEQHATAELLAALSELNSRKLYLGQCCSSLFTYCTRVLHLSEPAAYSRITAARAGRRFPAIFELLANGDVNLTTISLLAAHLDDDNHVALLESARHKTKREVERIVAALDPKPDIAADLRRAPDVRPCSGVEVAVSATLLSDPSAKPPDAAKPVALPAPPTPRPVIAPLTPDRYYLKVTIGQQTYDKLHRARDLLRHAIPTGDPAAVNDRALTALLVDLEKTRSGISSRSAVKRQTANPRHIPAAVKRAVWTRDQGRCAFEGSHGRCTETGFPEYHHVHPFADGGPPTVGNLELRCRAHNAHEAQVHLAATDFLFEADGGPS